jgi:hypothetical protein
MLWDIKFVINFIVSMVSKNRQYFRSNCPRKETTLQTQAHRRWCKYQDTFLVSVYRFGRSNRETEREEDIWNIQNCKYLSN